VYLPFWTFDAEASADWQAEAGFHYYVSETYTDSQGVKRERQVQHTRWEPAAGHVDHTFDDVLVSASVGVPTDLIEEVCPFPTEALIAYDPSYIKGWTVEHYQIDLIAGAENSRARMDSSLRALCAEQVPGDTHRALTVASEFDNLTFKHILVPVWLVTYTYGAKTFQVLVNGATGKVAGHYPKSWIKIALAVITALIVIGIIAFMSSQR